MKGDKGFIGKWLRHIWLSAGIVLALITPAQALIISVDGLLTNILETNKNIRSFYFELEAKVYDPEAFSSLEEKLEQNLVPFEMKESAFFQKIVWVRDEYYLVETLDYDETPLHMYITEPISRTYGRNLQENRFFTDEDVVYPYLYFFTKHVSYLRASLEEMGINAFHVSLRERENGIVYQLGDNQENIMVDPTSFKVVAINRMVQVNGRYFPMQIAFEEWDKTYPQLPLKTSFYINSRLFKEMYIKTRQRRVYTPRRNFLTKYHDTLPQINPFSLDIRYAN